MLSVKYMHDIYGDDITRCTSWKSSPRHSFLLDHTLLTSITSLQHLNLHLPNHFSYLDWSPSSASKMVKLCYSSAKPLVIHHQRQHGIKMVLPYRMLHRTRLVPAGQVTPLSMSQRLMK